MKPIPFYSLDFQHQALKEEVESRLTYVFTRGQFIRGSELTAFENEFATFSGTRFAVGVGNGLDALTLSLLAAGVTKTDEVIVPSHAYLACWLAVSRVGATIVPVEPDALTMNIDPNRIAEAITKRTKAIMPVHLYGQACDMSAINVLAEQYQISIVEDNAQSQGSSWEGKLTGSWGKVNATSFYPTKNLGALGDGGMVTTNDQSIYEVVQRLGNYGFESKNVASHQGFNSRLDEIQAAVLRIKLKKLNEWIAMRRAIATKYLERLSGVGDLILPYASKNAYHTYHLFVVQSNSRNGLQRSLREQMIETQIHYPIPVHLQKAYQELGFNKRSFPLAERFAESALSLPIWPGMTDDQIDYVCACIRKFF